MKRDQIFASLFGSKIGELHHPFKCDIIAYHGIIFLAERHTEYTVDCGHPWKQTLDVSAYIKR